MNKRINRLLEGIRRELGEAETKSDIKAAIKAAWAKVKAGEKLSRTDKIALVVEAIFKSEKRPAFNMETAAGRSPLTLNQFSSIARNNLEQINNWLGVLGAKFAPYRYRDPSVYKSGAGAFGRAGGGRVSRKDSANLLRRVG